MRDKNFNDSSLTSTRLVTSMQSKTFNAYLASREHATLHCSPLQTQQSAVQALSRHPPSNSHRPATFFSSVFTAANRRLRTSIKLRCADSTEAWAVMTLR